jgi:hypothetical protein
MHYRSGGVAWFTRGEDAWKERERGVNTSKEEEERREFV